jgi:AraC family transcriptional regulator, regulatory protein of adaptative response / methylated-DNA-[protein]-cysteine methyltransferase
MTSALSAHEHSDARWQAVIERDRRQDGRFFFAVSTTGVFCRPSCPSRRPNRENVEFFTRAEEAEWAGYRPCLRCRPLELDAQMRVVRRACALLTERRDENVTLAELASACDMSPFHLQRVFKKLTGVSPHAYQQALRTSGFKQMLTDAKSVTDAVYAAGYGSSSRAYERARERLGMTPGAYRKAGSGEEIRYGLFDSVVGRFLLAATERGVCSLRFGESDEPLVRELEREFAAAKLVHDAGHVQSLAEIVQRSITEGSTPELPLHMKATAFQAKVWAELRKIPAGETRTYTEVAAQLGNARAVRAVARACATNPVALAVPCHRVVRTGGELAGYRWGVERKRQLLQREAAAAKA